MYIMTVLLKKQRQRWREIQKEQCMAEDNVSKIMVKKEITVMLCPYNRTYQSKGLTCEFGSEEEHLV